jgi:phosphoribosylformylglycinamidine synthase
MKYEVNALILTGFGLNCDNETAHAFDRAGARSQRVHINELIHGQTPIENFQIMVFGGGFSWGDDHGAGVVQAVRMKNAIGDRMIRFIEDGNLVIGICNGFQTLVNLGLLPGLQGDYETRSVALTANECGNFRDQWVSLTFNPDSPCVFTRGMERAEFPVRHGEGKFYASSDILDRLIQNRQIVVQYAGQNGTAAGGEFPLNPNGSLHDIAGICDSTGRVFGLMPHPEAFNHWTNHPDWPRLKEEKKRGGEPAPSGDTPGIRMFRNAVEYIQGR